MGNIPNYFFLLQVYVRKEIKEESRRDDKKEVEQRRENVANMAAKLKG